MELANVLLTHTLMFIVTAFPWRPTYSNSAFSFFYSWLLRTWQENSEVKLTAEAVRNMFYCRWNKFYVLLTVHHCIISQLNPTTCSFLFNIYIYIYLFISLLFSTCFGRPCAQSSGEIYCIYATLALANLYVWHPVCWLDFNPTSRPDATHTEWQIPVSLRYRNFLLLMGTWTPETCR